MLSIQTSMNPRTLDTTLGGALTDCMLTGQKLGRKPQDFAKQIRGSLTKLQTPGLSWCSRSDSAKKRSHRVIMKCCRRRHLYEILWLSPWLTSHAPDALWGLCQSVRACCNASSATHLTGCCCCNGLLALSTIPSSSCPAS